MTTRHYITFARIILALPAECRLTIALVMADVFAAENPRFDLSRFLAACGCS